MKKRLIAFGMMVVLVMCLSMTAMAAGTITTAEKTVYDNFARVQGKYASRMDAKVVEGNLMTANRVLTELDLSDGACNDLNKIIEKWETTLATAPNATKKDLQAKRTQLISDAVNFKSDYFTVTANLDDKGVGSVTITLKDQPSGGGSGDSGSGSSATIPVGQGIINQTGVDTTATVAVFGGIALISLLGVGAFVASRNKKVAR